MNSVVRFYDQSAGRKPSPEEYAGLPPVTNVLLRQLSSGDLAEILKHADPVRLARRQAIHERHTPLRYVHFIESGAASLQAKAGFDRTNVEVRTLGRTDFVGIPLLHGVETSLHRCIVEVEGTALRLKVSDFLRLQAQLPGFRDLLLRYAHDAFVHSSQLVACNTRHNLRQRLARWLLVASDRLASERFAFTHASLSRAISVRRSGVTTEMGRMEQAGLIRRGRGTIIIVNREGLKAVSCGCHRVLCASSEPAAPMCNRPSRASQQTPAAKTYASHQASAGVSL